MPGQPCRQANEIAFKIRAGLNELFSRKSVNWIAYGDFSAIKILPNYNGPRPDDDTFIPCGSDYKRLDAKFDPVLSHALRCAVCGAFGRYRLVGLERNHKFRPHRSRY